MADGIKKISQLPEGTPLETDYTVFVDGVSGITKKTPKSELKGLKGDTGDTGPQGPQGETGPQGPQGPAGDMDKTVYDAANIEEQLVGIDAAQVVTNKDLRNLVLSDITDPTKRVVPVMSGITAGQTRLASFPNKNGTIAMLDDLDGYVPYTGATGDVDLGNNNLALNALTLLSTPSVLGTVVGQLYLNEDEGGLPEIRINNDNSLTIGTEMYTRVVNKTGVQVNDGQVVYINGAQGNRPTIDLAKADSAISSKVIGIATQNIADNAEGFITIIGDVHGFDTSGFTEGDTLYVSATTAGALTNIAPTSPNYIIAVGVALNSTVNGLVHCRPERALAANILLGSNNTIAPTQNAVKTYIDTIHADIKDPTGFLDNDNIVVTYDSVARTVTLTKGTAIEYYFNGTKYSLGTSWTSSAHSASNGKYFLYSTDGTTFAWSTTPFEYQYVQVALVNYQTSYKFGLKETHSINPYLTHYEFHNTIGTWFTGGDLSNYTLGSTTLKNPNTSATILHDEDNTVVNPANTSGTYTQHYISGAGASSNFVTGASTIVPVSGNQPYYNQFTGGAWQQTLLPTSQYMNLWQIAIPVSSDAGSQAYRYLWVQGQNASLSLPTIQALTPSSLNLGDLTASLPEFVFTNRVIIQYIGGNWNIVQVDKLTGNRVSQVSSPAGNYLSSVTTDATLTGNGTASSPLSVPASISGKVGTKSVDETDLANGKILVYNSTSGNLEYETPSAGGGSSAYQIADYQGQAIIGILGSLDINNATTLNEVSLVCDTLPVGSNLILEARKNSTTSGNIFSGTVQITTTESPTNGRYIVSTTGFTSASLADGDIVYFYLTSVGSTLPALNPRVICR